MRRFLAGVRCRPVCALMLAALSIYSVWNGIILIKYVPHYPPGKKLSYIGPQSFWGLELWGWMFVGVGLSCLVRLWLLRKGNPLIESLAHFACTFPLILWAIAFDLGPVSGGQPGYTYVAFTSCLVPLLVPITQWATHREVEEAIEKFVAEYTDAPGDKPGASDGQVTQPAAALPPLQEPANTSRTPRE